MAEAVAALEKDWATNPRWKGIKRNYSAADVVRLRGTAAVEHTLAKKGSEKLWNLINTEPFINSLGALTGNQAMQQVKAGLKAIYLSGWQVAGDANLAGEMYPDQSLYPANSVPSVVRRINNTLMRADQIQWMEGKDDVDYMAPIVADAEAGFGGVLNAYELMKAMIDALGVRLLDVCITELRESTFYAVLNIEGVGEPIDARPSDAIALAIRCGAGIYVAEGVLTEAGVLPNDDEDFDDDEEDENDRFEGEAEAEESKPERPKTLREVLQGKLDVAVKQEDYERAAQIRDEIDRLDRNS